MPDTAPEPPRLPSAAQQLCRQLGSAAGGSTAPRRFGFERIVASDGSPARAERISCADPLCTAGCRAVAQWDSAARGGSCSAPVFSVFPAAVQMLAARGRPGDDRPTAHVSADEQQDPPLPWAGVATALFLEASVGAALSAGQQPSLATCTSPATAVTVRYLVESCVPLNGTHWAVSAQEPSGADPARMATMVCTSSACAPESCVAAEWFYKPPSGTADCVAGASPDGSVASVVRLPAVAVSPASAFASPAGAGSLQFTSPLRITQDKLPLFGPIPATQIFPYLFGLDQQQQQQQQPDATATKTTASPTPAAPQTTPAPRIIPMSSDQLRGIIIGVLIAALSVVGFVVFGRSLWGRLFDKPLRTESEAPMVIQSTDDNTLPSYETAVIKPVPVIVVMDSDPASPWVRASLLSTASAGPSLLDRPSSPRSSRAASIASAESNADSAVHSVATL
nr:hypothetical protein HK105_002262 [Polyrhizophydium stewartii]